ncbi:YkvA family protein [Terrisporobacter sp.]
MNKTLNTSSKFLDIFKRILVKFRKSGFGIKLIKNLPKLTDYFNDRDVSILGKIKVFFSFVVTIIYFVFAIDIIPEVLFGPIGFLDDAFMIIWMIGTINEELEKYRGPKDYSIRNSKKVYKNPNIIDDVSYNIKDED